MNLSRWIFLALGVVILGTGVAVAILDPALPLRVPMVVIGVGVTLIGAAIGASRAWTISAHSEKWSVTASFGEAHRPRHRERDR